MRTRTRPLAPLCCLRSPVALGTLRERTQKQDEGACCNATPPLLQLPYVEPIMQYWARSNENRGRDSAVFSLNRVDAQPILSMKHEHGRPCMYEVRYMQLCQYEYMVRLVTWPEGTFEEGTTSGWQSREETPTLARTKCPPTRLSLPMVPTIAPAWPAMKVSSLLGPSPLCEDQILSELKYSLFIVGEPRGEQTPSRCVLRGALDREEETFRGCSRQRT